MGRPKGRRAIWGEGEHRCLGIPFGVDLRNLGESDGDVGHVGSQARDLTRVFGNGLLGK